EYEHKTYAQVKEVDVNCSNDSPLSRPLVRPRECDERTHFEDERIIVVTRIPMGQWTQMSPFNEILIGETCRTTTTTTGLQRWCSTTLDCMQHDMRIHTHR
ncbi:hypothetical protein RDWZM_000590, partial [Blomia tropicalis]